MALSVDSLTALIQQRLASTNTTVTDTSSGCGQCFEVVIVSPLFEGMGTLKRHRMVNEALKEELATIHAFSQKTHTPAEFEKLDILLHWHVLPKLTDSHNHIHIHLIKETGCAVEECVECRVGFLCEYPDCSAPCPLASMATCKINAFTRQLAKLTVGRMLVMGTQISDCSLMNHIAYLQLPHLSRLINCFGIHPWFIHLEQSHTPIADLSTHLSTHIARSTTPIILGEFGLDSTATDPVTKLKHSIDIQHSFFDAQFALAISLKLPVSLHCVKAFSLLISKLTIIQNKHQLSAIPSIMLHSFSGSPETLAQLVKMRLSTKLFFSFSYYVNARCDKQKWMRLIERAPDNAILIESDLECVEDVEPGLLRALMMVVEAKGWNVNYAVDILQANTDRYLANK